MKLTPNQEARASDYLFAAQVVENYQDARRLVELESLAKQLRRRFEAECSYQWADTDKYRARTDKLCEKARETAHYLRAMKLEINRDPRGAPLKFTVGGREYYLG